MKTQAKTPTATQSLAAALALAFFTLSAVVLLISSGLQLLSNLQAQQASISSQQQFIAQDATRTVSSFIQERFSVLETSARLANPVTATPDAQKQILESLLGLQPAFQQVILYDAQGKMLSRASRLGVIGTAEGAEQRLADLLARTRQDGSYISPAYIDPRSAEPLVLIAVPANSPLGDAQGALVAEVNLKFVVELIDQLKVGEAGLAYVVDRQGTLIAFRDSNRVLHEEKVGQLPIVNAFIHDQANQPQTQSTPYTGIKGELVVGTYVPLGTPDWAVVTELPWQEAYREFLQEGLQALLITAAMALLAALLGVVVARRLAVPLVALTKTATRIAQGEMELQASVSGPSEVASLATAFNSMTTQLRQILSGLEQQNAHLRNTVQKYSEHMAQLGRGNLAASLALDHGGAQPQNDPLLALGQQLNETAASLQSMTVQIRETATSLNSAAAEILAATTQQAAGASQQSAAIAQTSTTVDEVKVISEQSTTRAQEVANNAQRTVQVARAGQQAVQETIGAMGQIKERVEGIAENILALSEQTQQIGEIIATVNDIAEQSNMLALNASVEAARAGEHGKGFAVVAVEVRNLAEQSRQATAQIKSILSEIQKATNATVMATEEGSKGVDEGVKLAAQAGQAIEQLGCVIDESAQAAMQVVAGGRQQASGIEQVALAMKNINQATVQNLTSTRQAERAAQNLNQLAQQLNGAVSQYQL